MAVFIGSLSKPQPDKAYVQYYLKGKRQRIFFPKTSEALKFKAQFVKNIKQGVYRENFTDVTVKSMV